MKILRRIVFIIALIVFIGSAVYLVQYFWKAKQVQDDFAALKVNDGHNLEELHKQNSDIVGWLEIKGTNIDYPVMQTKTDPEFYLRKNFKKEYSLAGTPFLDAMSDMDIPSQNFMIYAHNMKNGTMFSKVLKYEDKEFYEKHKEINFDTLKFGDAKYKVVAAFYSEIFPTDSDNFKYYEYPSITSEEEYDAYITGVKGLSEYDTGVTPKYGQQLITLSTCAYHVDDGRFAVVAVKVN